MHDQIGITADRACEMSITVFAETVMKRIFLQIRGSRERTQEIGNDYRFAMIVRQFLQKPAAVRAVHQIAGPDVERLLHEEGKFIHFFRIGFGMHTEDSGNLLLAGYAWAGCGTSCGSRGSSIWECWPVCPSGCIAENRGER